MRSEGISTARTKGEKPHFAAESCKDGPLRVLGDRDETTRGSDIASCGKSCARDGDFERRGCGRGIVETPSKPSTSGAVKVIGES